MNTLGQWEGADYLAQAFADLNQYYAPVGGYQAALQISFAPPLLEMFSVSGVPDTEAGKVYKALPAIARTIAEKFLNAFDQRAITGALSPSYATRLDNLAKAILNGPLYMPFEQFAQDWQSNLRKLLDRPIFLWNKDQPLETLSLGEKLTVPVPWQKDGQLDYRPAPPYAVFLLSHLPFNSLTYDPTRGFYDRLGNLFLLYPLGWPSYNTYQFGKPSTEYPGRTFQLDEIDSAIKNAIDQIEKAQSKSFVVTAIVGTLAFFALPAAVTAIETGGFTLANSAKLLSAIDRIPGIDFGVGSDILRVVNRVSSLDVVQNVADTAEGVQMDDWGFGDWSDIAVTPGESWWDFDLGAGFNGPWDFGSGFGDIAVVPNSFDSTIESLTSKSSDIFGSFDIGSFLTGLAKTYVDYDLKKRQLEKTGTQTPIQTKPTPGTVKTLPDGSIMRTNADGSTTITSPNGQVRTVTPQGQIVQGGPSVFASIPPAVWIGGAVAIGALLLKGRK